ENLALERYIIEQTGSKEPRVAFVPHGQRRTGSLCLSLLFRVSKARMPALGPFLFQKNPGSSFIPAEPRPDLRRWREYEEHARRLARVGCFRNSSTGVGVGDRADRS